MSGAALHQNWLALQADMAGRTAALANGPVSAALTAPFTWQGIKFVAVIRHDTISPYLAELRFARDDSGRNVLDLIEPDLIEHWNAQLMHAYPKAADLARASLSYTVAARRAQRKEVAS